jgi:ATP-dependent DNA helicase RecQ
MAYLQTALDDPNPAPCGRCSVCTGALPGPGALPGSVHLDAARTFLRGVDQIIQPRKRWPGGVSRKGAIAGIVEGRAVAFADDPGWSDEVAALTRSAWSVIPDEMLAGAVATLGRWRTSWSARPVVVVPAPAHGAEARANRLLAEHLASVGKLPLVDCFTWSGGAAPLDSASGPVVAHLERAVVLDTAAQFQRGPVLLCATSMRTGWSLTVAAALLREAGCGTSLPLVLHRRP